MLFLIEDILSTFLSSQKNSSVYFKIILWYSILFFIDVSLLLLLSIYINTIFLLGILFFFVAFTYLVSMFTLAFHAKHAISLLRLNVFTRKNLNKMTGVMTITLLAVLPGFFSSSLSLLGFIIPHLPQFVGKMLLRKNPSYAVRIKALLLSNIHTI